MGLDKVLAAAASVALVYGLLAGTGNPLASTLGLAVGLTVLCLPGRPVNAPQDEEA